MKILDILKMQHGNAKIIRYCDGSIGLLVNNATYATERDDIAYYANSIEYKQRHTLLESVWVALRREDNEVVTTENRG